MDKVEWSGGAAVTVGGVERVGKVAAGSHVPDHTATLPDCHTTRPPRYYHDTVELETQHRLAGQWVSQDEGEPLPVEGHLRVLPHTDVWVELGQREPVHAHAHLPSGVPFV